MPCTPVKKIGHVIGGIANDSAHAYVCEAIYVYEVSYRPTALGRHKVEATIHASQNSQNANTSLKSAEITEYARDNDNILTIGEKKTKMEKKKPIYAKSAGGEQKNKLQEPTATLLE